MPQQHPPASTASPRSPPVLAPPCHHVDVHGAECRAGPGSKIVCLGNIAQIDTPYLTETTSGLTYVVDRFKQWEHSGHITLQRGERSRLADYASEIL